MCLQDDNTDKFAGQDYEPSEKFAVVIVPIDGRLPRSGGVVTRADYRALLRAVHAALLEWGTFNDLEQAPAVFEQLTDSLGLRR